MAIKKKKEEEPRKQGEKTQGTPIPGAVFDGGVVSSGGKDFVLPMPRDKIEGRTTPVELSGESGIAGRMQQDDLARQEAVKEEFNIGEAPVARDLVPDTTSLSSGVLGGMGIGDESASAQAARVQSTLSLIDPSKIKDMTYEDFLMHPDVVNNPLFTEVIQNEIDLEVFKTGEALATDFGTFIEAIPGIGGAARKWAGSLITTPSSQIDDINTEIGTQMAYARNIREWVGMKTVTPEYAREEFDRLESRMRFLESKLKILMMQSAELRSSPEEIQAIQSTIHTSLNVIWNGRLKAAMMAGAGGEPSAEQLYSTYQKVKS